MDRCLEALAAFGGSAAIGGLIDLAMYKSENAKLKAKLEDWWLRFTDVKWSNFDRKEGCLASTWPAHRRSGSMYRRRGT
jgi:hypothetical protein